MKLTFQIVKLPSLCGLISVCIFLVVNMIFEQQDVINGMVIIGISFYATGIFNSNTTLNFKMKTLRLFVFAFVFFIGGLISFLLFFSQVWLYVRYFVKLTGIVLLIGFLMNTFLIMKRGHWMAIIVLGLLTIFSFVNSFLQKAMNELQLRKFEETMKINQELREELKMTKVELEMNKIIMDSLKTELDKK